MSQNDPTSASQHFQLLLAGHTPPTASFPPVQPALTLPTQNYVPPGIPHLPNGLPAPATASGSVPAPISPNVDAPVVPYNPVAVNTGFPSTGPPPPAALFYGHPAAHPQPSQSLTIHTLGMSGSGFPAAGSSGGGLSIDTAFQQAQQHAARDRFNAINKHFGPGGSKKNYQKAKAPSHPSLILLIEFRPGAPDFNSKNDHHVIHSVRRNQWVVRLRKYGCYWEIEVPNPSVANLLDVQAYIRTLLETGPLEYRFPGLDDLLSGAQTPWDQLPFYCVTPCRRGFIRADGTRRGGFFLNQLTPEQMTLDNIYNNQDFFAPRNLTSPHPLWNTGIQGKRTLLLIFAPKTPIYGRIPTGDDRLHACHYRRITWQFGTSYEAEATEQYARANGIPFISDDARHEVLTSDEEEESIDPHYFTRSRAAQATQQNVPAQPVMQPSVPLAVLTGPQQQPEPVTQPLGSTVGLHAWSSYLDVDFLEDDDGEQTSITNMATFLTFCSTLPEQSVIEGVCPSSSEHHSQGTPTRMRSTWRHSVVPPSDSSLELLVSGITVPLMVDSLLEKMRTALSTHSPSKLFAKEYSFRILNAAGRTMSTGDGVRREVLQSLLDSLMEKLQPFILTDQSGYFVVQTPSHMSQDAPNLDDLATLKLFGLACALYIAWNGVAPANLSPIHFQMFLHGGSTSAITRRLLYAFAPSVLEQLQGWCDLEVTEHLDEEPFPTMFDLFFNIDSNEPDLQSRTPKLHAQIGHALLLAHSGLFSLEPSPHRVAFEEGLAARDGEGGWTMFEKYHQFGADTYYFITTFFGHHITTFKDLESKLTFFTKAPELPGGIQEESGPAVSSLLQELRRLTRNPEATFRNFLIGYLQGTGPIDLSVLQAGAERGFLTLPSDLQDFHDPSYRVRLFCRCATGTYSLADNLTVNFIDESSEPFFKNRVIQWATCLKYINIPTIALINRVRMALKNAPPTEENLKKAEEACHLYFLVQSLQVSGTFGMM